MPAGSASQFKALQLMPSSDATKTEPTSLQAVAVKGRICVDPTRVPQRQEQQASARIIGSQLQDPCHPSKLAKPNPMVTKPVVNTNTQISRKSYGYEQPS